MSIQKSIAVLLLCVFGACAEAEPASLPLERRVNDTIGRARGATEMRIPGRVDSPASQPSRRRTRERLSTLADSLARDLVIAPATQTWFAAAARGKRLVIDIGRADVRIGDSPEHEAAFQEVVRLRTPLPIGSRVRVHGPWGADDATIAGFELWNDRIVALVSESPRVDSLARRIEPLPAAVERVTESRSPITRSCARAPLGSSLLARTSFVRDSIAQAILAAEQPPYPRVAESLRVTGSRLPGCFGVGRVLLIVSVRAEAFEWVRERFVIVDDLGGVHPLATTVYRHRAHDAVAAMDADGDGVDDLAVRIQAPGAGSLAILRLRAGKRLVHVASGFAWETLDR